MNFSVVGVIFMYLFVTVLSFMVAVARIVEVKESGNGTVSKKERLKIIGGSIVIGLALLFVYYQIAKCIIAMLKIGVELHRLTP